MKDLTKEEYYTVKITAALAPFLASTYNDDIEYMMQDVDHIVDGMMVGSKKLRERRMKL